MSKIFFDQAGISRERITGWERSSKDLENLLSNLPTKEELYFHYLKNPAKGKVDYVVKELIWRCKREMADEFEIYHSHTLPPIKTKAKVTWTIHDDLILGGHPEYQRKGAKIWNRFAHDAVKRSSKIITFTKVVADELFTLGVPHQKIEILKPYIAPLMAESILEGLEMNIQHKLKNEKFAIVVGSIEVRKNPLKAVELIYKAGYLPVLAGKLVNIKSSEIPDYVLSLGSVSDGNLKYLYENASFLVSASAYEGVNMPIYEALKYGLPVIASDIPVHRELLQTGVELIDFQDDSYLKKYINYKPERIEPIKSIDGTDYAKKYLEIWHNL